MGRPSGVQTAPRQPTEGPSVFCVLLNTSEHTVAALAGTRKTREIRLVAGRREGTKDPRCSTVAVADCILATVYGPEFSDN